MPAGIAEKKGQVRFHLMAPSSSSLSSLLQSDP